MARGDDKLSTEDRVKGSVRRTFTNLAVLLIVLGVAGVWGSFGAFTLKPGEAAVLLLFGEHYQTITQDGFHLSIPPPLVERFILTFEKEQLQDFGFSGAEGSDTSREDLMEATMQTSGNNIVRLSFALQYKIKDPFLARFQLAEPVPVLRDAAQAAMREVVGRMEVDGVLREQRGLVVLGCVELVQAPLILLALRRPAELDRLEESVEIHRLGLGLDRLGGGDGVTARGLLGGGLSCPGEQRQAQDCDPTSERAHDFASSAARIGVRIRDGAACLRAMRSPALIPSS